jgi:hypothetical protein
MAETKYPDNSISHDHAHTGHAIGITAIDVIELGTILNLKANSGKLACPGTRGAIGIALGQALALAPSPGSGWVTSMIEDVFQSLGEASGAGFGLERG